MKKTILFVIAFCLAWSYGKAQNDCEMCKPLLQNGLYKTFKMERTGNFEKDLKTYFSSDVFKQDYKDKKWGGDISVIIDISPFSLKANSSDTELNTFQESIRQASSIRLSNSFYDFSLSSIPDVELAEKYNDCIRTCVEAAGFKPSIDVSDDQVTFTIFYKINNISDPLPRVTNFGVIDGQIIFGNFTKYQTIPQISAVVCKRIPGKDLIFILETDKGVVSYRIPGEQPGFNADLPVGTIISSYLDFAQFSTATSNNVNSPGKNWTSRFSKWAPADGRQVPYSKFSSLTSRTNVPDLRGVFLRGLNSFDPYGQNKGVADSLKDPMNRVVGEPQTDALQGHWHSYLDDGLNYLAMPGKVNEGFSVSNVYNNTHITSVRDDVKGAANPIKDGKGNGIPRISNETRPKNVALYYYIRIN